MKPDESIDKIKTHLSSIDISLALHVQQLERLTDSLELHIKRWAASEARIEHLEKRWEAHLGKVEGAITAFKALGWTFAVIYTIIQLIDKLL